MEFLIAENIEMLKILSPQFLPEHDSDILTMYTYTLSTILLFAHFLIIEFSAFPRYCFGERDFSYSALKWNFLPYNLRHIDCNKH